VIALDDAHVAGSRVCWRPCRLVRNPTSMGKSSATFGLEAGFHQRNLEVEAWFYGTDRDTELL